MDGPETKSRDLLRLRSHVPLFGRAQRTHFLFNQNFSASGRAGGKLWKDKMSISSFNQMSTLLLGRQRQKQKQIGVFKSLASNFLCSSSFSSTSNSKTKKLILYSKPGCCLCDGLKEKLHAAFSLSVQDSLHDIHLEVRDITTNPEWERAYQYEIPVLAKVGSDGAEGKLIPTSSDLWFWSQWSQDRADRTPSLTSLTLSRLSAGACPLCYPCNAPIMLTPRRGHLPLIARGCRKNYVLCLMNQLQNHG